jgi:hypothetical protein
MFVVRVSLHRPVPSFSEGLSYRMEGITLPLIEAPLNAGENEFFLPSLRPSVTTVAWPLPGLQRVEHDERGTAGANR